MSETTTTPPKPKPAKHKPGASLLASLLLAMHSHLDADTITNIVQDAANLMQEFKAMGAKKSTNG